MKIDQMMRPKNFEYTPEVLDLSAKRESRSLSDAPNLVDQLPNLGLKLEKRSPEKWDFKPVPQNDCVVSQEQMQIFPKYYNSTELEVKNDPSPNMSAATKYCEGSNEGLPTAQIGKISPFDFIRNAAVLQQQLMKQFSPPPNPELLVKIENQAPQQGAVLQPRLSPDSTSIYPSMLVGDGRISRPFKAYPRDPITLAASFTATDALLDAEKAEKYRAFRKRMLEQMHASNGGRPTVTNPKMRRNIPQKNVFQEEHANDSSSGNEASNLEANSVTGEINHSNNSRDASYYERRKKNNAAAKKSRDRRRIKEDEIAVRAAFLENENIELRIQLAALRNQLALVINSQKG